MIYVLAFLLPPLALLIEGKPFSALFNVILIAVSVVITVVSLFNFAILLLVPPAHAILVIAQSRRQREHRELVTAAREGRLRLDP